LEGPDEWVQMTLASSLPEGINETPNGGRIEVVQVYDVRTERRPTPLSPRTPRPDEVRR